MRVSGLKTFCEADVRAERTPRGARIADEIKKFEGEVAQGLNILATALSLPRPLPSWALGSLELLLVAGLAGCTREGSFL